MYVVVGALHWIGYHIIDHLLLKGEEVLGIDSLDSDLKTHLLLSIGRNSNFTFREDAENALKEVRQQKPTNILFIDYSCQSCNDLLEQYPCYLIHTKTIREKSALMTYIHTPMIYGSWMPRDKNCLYWNDKRIPFNSVLFNEEGVSIEDFVLVVMQIINAKLKPMSIELKSANKEMISRNKSIIYIIEERNTNTKLEELEDHFQQYHELY